MSGLGITLLGGQATTNVDYDEYYSNNERVLYTILTVLYCILSTTVYEHAKDQEVEAGFFNFFDFVSIFL